MALLTTDEAARVLRNCPKTLLPRVRSDKVPATRIGHKHLFCEEAMSQLLKSRQAATVAIGTVNYA